VKSPLQLTGRTSKQNDGKDLGCAYSSLQEKGEALYNHRNRGCITYLHGTRLIIFPQLINRRAEVHHQLQGLV